MLTRDQFQGQLVARLENLQEERAAVAAYLLTEVDRRLDAWLPVDDPTDNSPLPALLRVEISLEVIGRGVEAPWLRALGVFTPGSTSTAMQEKMLRGILREVADTLHAAGWTWTYLVLDRGTRARGTEGFKLHLRLS